MTSLPAVPHSPSARWARSPCAAARSCPSSRPAGRPAGSLAALRGPSPARPPGLSGGGRLLPPGPQGPQPRARGARCPRGAGRTHGAPEAPTGRLRGDTGQWPRPPGGGTGHRRRRDAPARACQPARLGASRSFLGPRPPRLLPALPLPSCLSPLRALPPAPLPPPPVGGTGTS